MPPGLTSKEPPAEETEKSPPHKGEITILHRHRITGVKAGDPLHDFKDV
jgi:hypothetical protein